jgi:hypothetical protein
MAPRRARRRTLKPALDSNDWRRAVVHLTNDGSIYRKFVFLLLANLFKIPTILHFPQFAAADVARAKLPIRLLRSMCRHNVAPFGPADQVSHAAEISAAFDSGEEVEPFHGKSPRATKAMILFKTMFLVIGYDASTESFTLHILGVRYPRTRRHSRCRLMSWPKAAAIWRSREGAHPARKRPARYGGITCQPMAASHGTAAHLL